jgi:hypothetical protein
MDIEYGNLIMQTPGDSEKMLSVADHTDFLLFDLERRNDLRSNFPNMLNPSETEAIISIAMSKIYKGLGRSTHEETKEAERAADFIGAVVHLISRASLKLDTITEAQTDSAHQAPEVEPKFA